MTVMNYIWEDAEAVEARLFNSTANAPNYAVSSLCLTAVRCRESGEPAARSAGMWTA
jgi:hypothetical protein